MKTITLAIGLMVLIALSPQAMAGDGEPDPKIEIDTELLKIEFVNLEGTAWNIDFIRGQGDGSNIVPIGDIIPYTIGWAYYVIVGDFTVEPVNGQSIDLPTGTYTIVATAVDALTSELIAEATATVYVP
ncbi:MAG: hypothetical protein E4G94_09445 [ANME-2 cluster archaeon]|nr:MAG: hypothetical protein E4G94_09445 [ANME-2 cluster archaeon]